MDRRDEDFLAYVTDRSRRCRAYGRSPWARPEYPEALRQAARERWWAEARQILTYARSAHAEKCHLTDCAGAIATATCQTAHAVMAQRGQWVTNEKTLLERAGLRDIDHVLSGLTRRTLPAAIDEATATLEKAVERA